MWTWPRVCLQVNRTQAHLPLSLASGQAHVYFSDSGAMLETDAGLLVSYDGATTYPSWCPRPTLAPSAACVGTSMGTPMMTLCP